MGKALYRKYRSKTLSEVLGQEHITTALTNALKKGAVSHAYLFTGPRGVGKTSTARILAHAVNDLPYDEEQSHLDIIEIDAASNRRIDEIRELRDRIHAAPTSAKYKVYIIDEVHMLTKEAFNALLKTLEEPPAHVIFILATTEAHKLPETIISRTQRYTFKPAESASVVNHLRSIANKEKMDITDEALALIARHGGGSFRDSVSLLDQARNIGGAIDTTEVGQLMGIAPAEAVAGLWQTVEQQNTSQLIAMLSDLKVQGYQSGQLAKQIAQQFRAQLIEGYHSPERLMQALRELLEVPTSHDPDTALEIALLRLTLQGETAAASIGSTTTAAPKSHDTPPPAKPLQPKPDTPKPQSTPTSADNPETPKAIDTAVDTPQPTISRELDAEVWQEIIEAFKQHHKTIYSVVRMATAEIDGNTVTLAFKFAFHQKRLNEAKNKQIITSVIKEKTGKDITLNLTVVDTSIPTPSSSPQAPPASLEAVTNVFGGGEILDS